MYLDNYSLFTEQSRTQFDIRHHTVEFIYEYNLNSRTLMYIEFSALSTGADIHVY